MKAERAGVLLSQKKISTYPKHTRDKTISNRGLVHGTVFRSL